MDDTIFGNDFGLGEIGVPVLHSVTYELVSGGCIHHSTTAVVVEGRVYSVAIAAAEVPYLACVGIVVYEYMAHRRSNGGGVVVERAIEVLPCLHGWV